MRWNQFFGILLIEGLLNTQSGHIFNETDQNMTIIVRKKAYIDAAQEYLNRNFLGSNKNITQYQLPVETKIKVQKQKILE